MNIKCFDAVEMVVEEANRQFSPIWEMNKDNYQILKQYCDVIDKLSKEYEGESYEVEIDDIVMTISITMDCLDMIVDKNNKELLQIAERAISIEFSTNDDGMLSIKFVFPSLWERAY